MIDHSTLSNLALQVQLVSLPLEICGFFLILVEIFLKEKIQYLEERLSTFLLAMKILYLTFFLTKKIEKLEAETKRAKYRKADEMSARIINVFLYLVILLICIYVLGIIYLSYFLTSHITESEFLRYALTIVIVIIVLFFSYQGFTFGILLARYGKGGKGEWFLIVIFIILFSLILIPLIIIFPIYILNIILNRLGKGKVIGGIGIVMAFFGICGEIFQVYVQCLTGGLCYFG